MHKLILVLVSTAALAACSSTSGTDAPGGNSDDGGDAGSVSPTTEAGAHGDDDGGISGDANGGSDAGDVPDAGSLIWPNDASSANSDPWIAAHHDEITEMHPRALLLHFANGKSVKDVTTRWNDMTDAMNTGTAYHGYNDPSAKPFIVHELLKLVDLTDKTVPPNWTAPNSSLMPRLNGGIDFSKLYTQDMADKIGIPDPANAGHNMTLCELLQKGVMNELFIAFNKQGTDGNVPEIIEYKQMYDSKDKLLKGQFDPYAGNGAFDPADLPEAKACGRSLRVDFLEMNAGISGAMHVLSHNFEHIDGAVPNVKKFFYPLMNRDFDVRFHTPFQDWYGISVNASAANFVSYPDQNTAVWTCPAGSSCDGQTGTMAPFNQGCGNTHYAPNSRNSYDMQNTQVVLTRCEHYGLQDGPNGEDIQTPYSAATVAKLAQKYGNDGNGGGWQIYFFQSFPGLRNKAKLPDGTPIKNFWPYLYY